jgi:hypothetical protein
VFPIRNTSDSDKLIPALTGKRNMKRVWPELQIRLGREALPFGVPAPSAFYICGVMP